MNVKTNSIDSWRLRTLAALTLTICCSVSLVACGSSDPAPIVNGDAAGGGTNGGAGTGDASGGGAGDAAGGGAGESESGNTGDAVGEGTGNSEGDSAGDAAGDGTGNGAGDNSGDRADGNADTPFAQGIPTSVAPTSAECRRVVLTVGSTANVFDNVVEDSGIVEDAYMVDQDSLLAGAEYSDAAGLESILMGWSGEQPYCVVPSPTYLAANPPVSAPVDGTPLVRTEQADGRVEFRGDGFLIYTSNRLVLRSGDVLYSWDILRNNYSRYSQLRVTAAGEFKSCHSTLDIPGSKVAQHCGDGVQKLTR